MKYEMLARAMSELDDDLLEDAQRGAKPRGGWRRWCAAAACLVLLCTGALWYRAPAVTMNGSAVTQTPRSIAGEAAVMSLRLHEPQALVTLELTLRRETALSVSAGTLQLFDEAGNELFSGTDGTARGTVCAVWAVDDAAEVPCTLTVGSVTLLLERSGAEWTIRRR